MLRERRWPRYLSTGSRHRQGNPWTLIHPHSVSQRPSPPESPNTKKSASPLGEYVANCAAPRRRGRSESYPLATLPSTVYEESISSPVANASTPVSAPSPSTPNPSTTSPCLAPRAPSIVSSTTSARTNGKGNSLTTRVMSRMSNGIIVGLLPQARMGVSVCGVRRG